MKFFPAFCVLLSFLTVNAYRNYTNYRVYKVIPNVAVHIDRLRALEARGKFEIMNTPRLNGPVYLMFEPTMISLKALTKLSDMQPTLHINNVHSGINAERIRLQNRYRADPYSFDLNDFNTYDSVMRQIEVWISKCPSGLSCTSKSIGKTFLGNDLRVMKVKKIGTSNKAFWLDSMIHAREWLSLATLLNIINHVFEDYGSNPEVTSLVDKYDLYFMPVMNPDGYEFTFSDDRLWRKNVQDYDTNCNGTDLNRNFDITAWGREGVSHWPCFDTYCGPDPGSELETKAIQAELKKIIDQQGMVAYVSYHCFGNMWVFPPGSTVDHAGNVCEEPKDRTKLMAVTNAGVDALEATHSREGKWLRGSICETIYPVTGSSGEYVHEHGVMYAFTLELRGHWFVVDKSEIKPSYEEVWNGMIGMVKKIEEMA